MGISELPIVVGYYFEEECCLPTEPQGEAQRDEGLKRAIFSRSERFKCLHKALDDRAIQNGNPRLLNRRQTWRRCDAKDRDAVVASGIDWNRVKTEIPV